MDNKTLAKDVLKLVGGETNVNSVVHCATRLRFSLKDEGKANTAALKNHDGVIQVVQSGGQYQVVIGSHVSDVYNELIKGTKFEAGSEESDGKKGNIFNQFIDIISSIFTPFLGAMAGAGVLKGFLTLALTLNWVTADSGVYLVLFAVADGLFTYLPIILAMTAAKKFKTNQYLAVSLAMALVHPSINALAGSTLHFFGIPVILGASGYTSSVIPIILAVYVQSYVEKFFKKVIPSFLQIICTPLATFLVMAPVTFIALGPIGTILGNLLGGGYNSIYSLSPILAGAVMGGLWQVFVMFGMHWGFVPIMMLNLSDAGVGFDTMAPMLLPAVIAQGGAALAVFFRTKDVKLKGLSISSFITSLFGITEPTVYGVTLPLKKPFIAACIGGAMGGAYIGFSHVTNYTFGLISLLSLPGFIPQDTGSMAGVVNAVIGTVVAFVIAFMLTLILGFKEVGAEEVKEPAKNVASKKDGATYIVKSPLTGEILPLTEVKDEVFSSGAMGRGIAILPAEGTLVAPVDGVVSTIFPTGHAVGMTSNDGVEILMHIGMDTVALSGEGFTKKVAQGDMVKAGDVLVTFDIEKIKAAGYEIVTPIVITNSGDYLDILDYSQKEVVIGEDLLAIVDK